MSNIVKGGISLGEGVVSITTYENSNGNGLLFTDTKKKHKVGDRDFPPLESPYIPSENDFLIHCSNRESALVLMEQTCRLVARFSAHDSQSQKE